MVPAFSELFYYLVIQRKYFISHDNQFFVYLLVISFFVFRCDEPTHNTSPCAFCFVRGFEYLTLPLDITALHLVPVRLPFTVKLLIHWWWFELTAWHNDHNLEWTSSHRILNVSFPKILLWEFQLMICSNTASTESPWSRVFNWLIGCWWHDDPLINLIFVYI